MFRRGIWEKAAKAYFLKMRIKNKKENSKERVNSGIQCKTIVFRKVKEEIIIR